VIFSRGRGRHSREDEGGRRAARHQAGSRETGSRAGGGEAAEERAPAQVTGPYDVSEAPPGVERIDLGSLQIPAVDGVEVRVQASQDGVVQQVVLVHGDSALQLGVFAAPRSSGIWPEVREELRESVTGAISVQEVEGEYGTELRARVRTPEGPVDLRFLGIDGPRWMVRALFQGRAAVEPDAAGPLAECLAGLVVVRGWEAMPVRDPLPLRLPREVAERATMAAEEQQPPGVNGRPVDGGGTGGTGGTTGGDSGGSGGSRRGPGPKPSRPRRRT
jgi:hypothetical protein